MNFVKFTKKGSCRQTSTAFLSKVGRNYSGSVFCDELKVSVDYFNCFYEVRYELLCNLYLKMDKRGRDN